MAFVGRKPTNAPLTSDDIPNGIISAADLASGISGLITWQSVKTSGFTAVAGQGYPCNTTSSAFTVTLPASPSAGDTILLVDYAGTFSTNNLTINPNSLKIQSQTSNVIVSKNNEALTLTYIDSTSGWLVSSGANEGTGAISIPYSVDFLVIAGGGSGGHSGGAGGGGAGGYRNSYSTETSGGGGSSETSLTFSPGTVYTITVGAGGASQTTGGQNGNTGSDSSISGSGLTTLTSSGGGGGGGNTSPGAKTGGSGGGGSSYYNTGASGTANQGYAGGTGGTSGYAGAGGGGSSAIGGNASGTSPAGNGGNGLASSITGSSVTRGGGGGGGVYQGTAGTGGTGGGGNGYKQDPETAGTAGTANTGGGGGGANVNSYAGGSGVVILRMPTAKYSGTTTGSPTVSTSGSDTILVFNASGSYTG
jgi:hypothetical protein